MLYLQDIIIGVKLNSFVFMKMYYGIFLSQGYVNRQALYACGTCSPTDEDLAGICLACSLECHDGHELFELYTKVSWP